MSADAELELMKWMSVEQLASYADAIEQVEAAEAEKAEILRAVAGRESEPLLQILGPEKFDRLLWVTERSHGHNKLEILKQVSSKFPAFSKLLPIALSAIGDLVDEGQNPTSCGGKDKFWGIVLMRILAQHGSWIKKDKNFKHVQILEFLKDVLPTRLKDEAERAREEGNPILAQVMEELSEEAK